MGGFNLPPGCSVSDIPGNRPEDGKWEAIEEAFWNNDKNCSKKLFSKFEEANLDSDLINIVINAIEYGIEIQKQQAVENAEENKYYETMFEDYKQEKIRDILDYIPMMEV